MTTGRNNSAWGPGPLVLLCLACGPVPAAGFGGGAAETLAPQIVAHSRIHGEQADVTRMTDGDPATWWSTGPGDLALNPLDVDLRWEAPCVVDSVRIVTTRLKGQLRLIDFELYGGLGGVWDGAHPLARVCGNRERTIEVRFPAVRVDRLRLRILGSERPDNAFAHIAELTVFAAAGQPVRQIQASPFPPSLADAGHDPVALGQLIRSFEAEAEAMGRANRRLGALKQRLALIEESRTYEAVLERIGSETDRFRRLHPPPWALAQRDAMARLRTWAYYWIDHQGPDGQFGAGYEDDVELVCGWPVLVLAQDDEKVRRSLELLADGVWRSRPFLERFGYDRLTDVEHAAENTSYSQPRMVVIDRHNPKWIARCRRTVATMAEHFLSRNQRGWLQFRSDYFGFDPKTLRPVTRQKGRPFDIPESAKALKPAMYAVWATEDDLCRRIMLDYGRTWVQAAAAADGSGRIAGLLPERILWPSGRTVGTHARISSMRATLFHLIGCYYVSRDEAYLEPIRMLLRKTLLEWSAGDIPSAGTLDEVRDEDWTGLLEQLALVAILYRRATGDGQFDPALVRWASRIRDTLVDGVKSYVLVNRKDPKLWYVDRPLTVGAYRESRCTAGAQLYLGWLVTGDDDYLARLGWNLSSCLTDRWGAFTYWFYDKSEPRVTSNDHLAHKIQSSESALCLMYLGGPGPVEAVWPQFAVTWRDVGQDFCALVRENGPRRLRVDLYDFGQQPQGVTACLWGLEPGAYQAVLRADSGRQGQPRAIHWQSTLQIAPQGERRRPFVLRLPLPPRTLATLEVYPAA